MGRKWTASDLIDCGSCKRRVRGPWMAHSATDSHNRAQGPAQALRQRHDPTPARWRWSGIDEDEYTS